MLPRYRSPLSRQIPRAFCCRTSKLHSDTSPRPKAVLPPEISSSTLFRISRQLSPDSVEKHVVQRLRRLESDRARAERALGQNVSLLKRVNSPNQKQDSLNLLDAAARLSNLLHAAGAQVRALENGFASIQHQTHKDFTPFFIRWDLLDSAFTEKFEIFKARFSTATPITPGPLIDRRERLLRQLRKNEGDRRQAREQLLEVGSAQTLHIIERAEEGTFLELYRNGVGLNMKRFNQDRNQNGAGKRRKLNAKPAPLSLAECGTADVLEIEAKALLAKPRTSELKSRDSPIPLQFSAGRNETPQESRVENVESTFQSVPPLKKIKEPMLFREFELDIEDFSSIGEGLARHPTESHVYVIPFALPGDTVKIKGAEPTGKSTWSKADFLEIINPSKLREGTTPQCQYFSKCGGCQLQMVSYEDQLKFKRSIVQEAYRNFSGLEPSQIPEIGPTGGSPLQYGYRTKLTPHFDGPKKGTRFTPETVPPIGFTRKNFQKVMDIENCVIGTPILQKGLHTERAKIVAQIGEYKRGATILLRETTDRSFETAADAETQKVSPLPLHALEINGLELQPTSEQSTPTPNQNTPTIHNTYLHTPSQTTIHETKSYTTNNEATSTEHIGAFTFKTRAGSFFQNNNSILPSFLSYVRSKILPSNTATNPPPPQQPIKYLLDAYCGSGLFALTLSPLFTSVLGIELDPHGVTSARANAKLNNITNCGFIEADAAALFQDVPFPPHETALVIDPPRKGCSTDFLRQLLAFGPRRVVYVSCNVGTQARDVGCLVRGRVGEDWWKGVDGEEEKKGERWRYEVEEVRGYDFFPQTGHVEGLAILRRVEREGWVGEGEGNYKPMDV